MSACAGLAHAFLLRQPGIDFADDDRAIALTKLARTHHAGVAALGFEGEALRTARQVHGAKVVPVEADAGDRPDPEADGLLTCQAGVLLGIQVADCCAVYVVDPVRRALALLHSGRRGTELGILPEAIDQLGRAFGSSPRDLFVQLSPCIRPPHYEIDFAASIRRQALEGGVLPERIHDTGECTACHLDKYYSYRAEGGRTGRMLALLGFRPAREE